eukprot:Ihof_evm2s315 gene=Ihof_evmTU2s315
MGTDVLDGIEANKIFIEKGKLARENEIMHTVNDFEDVKISNENENQTIYIPHAEEEEELVYTEKHGVLMENEPVHSELTEVSKHVEIMHIDDMKRDRDDIDIRDVIREDNGETGEIVSIDNNQATVMSNSKEESFLVNEMSMENNTMNSENKVEKSTTAHVEEIQSTEGPSFNFDDMDMFGKEDFKHTQGVDIRLLNALDSFKNDPLPATDVLPVLEKLILQTKFSTLLDHATEPIQLQPWKRSYFQCLSLRSVGLTLPLATYRSDGSDDKIGKTEFILRMLQMEMRMELHEEIVMEETGKLNRSIEVQRKELERKLDLADKYMIQEEEEMRQQQRRIEITYREKIEHPELELDEDAHNAK